MAKRKEPVSALRALPARERERIVGEVLAELLPILDEPPGDLDAVRGFARRVGCRFVPIAGLLVGDEAERRAWLNGGAR